MGFFFSPSFWQKLFLLSRSPCGFSICGPCVAVLQVPLSALFFLMILNYSTCWDRSFQTLPKPLPTHAWHSFLPSPPSSPLPLKYTHSEAGVILLSSQSIQITMWLCYSTGTRWSWELDCYCLMPFCVKSVAHTGLCTGTKDIKQNLKKKTGWGFMQAALSEFPHTSLVTPNIANLHHFKAAADMKYSAAVLLLQRTVKKKQKRKKNPVHDLPAHF